MKNNLGNCDSLFSLQSDLVKKIRQQRGVHAFYESKTRKISTIHRFLNIFFTATISLLAISDIGLVSSYIDFLTVDSTRLIIGLIAFTLFLENVFVQIFSINQRHKNHRKAIELYTDLLEEIRKISISDKSLETKKTILSSVNDRYTQISYTTIKFTDKKFEKGYAGYLRYQARQMVRKDNPFAWWWQINKKAKSKLSEWKEREGDLDI